VNVAVSQRLELAANSVNTAASFRTERGRLYTIIATVGEIGGTIRIRYTPDGSSTVVDHTLQAPDPAIFAVASDLTGTIEVLYEYAAAPEARYLPLVVAKEITV